MALVRATPIHVKCAVRCTVKVICRRAREDIIEKTIHIYIHIGECGSTLYVGLSGIVRNLIQKSTG